MKRLFSVTLITFSVIYLFIIFIKNINIYSIKYSPQAYEKKYYQSQWSIPNSKNPISDEELYSYAGYRYIKGTNPILINPEAPPLGKYLIGLSIILFNNQNIIPLIINVLSLIIIFYFVFIMTSSLLAGSISVFLTVINSLYIDQIIHPTQLEGMQLFFLLLFFLFFSLMSLRGTKQSRYILLAGISIGLFLATKVFILHWALINLFFLIYFFLKKEKVINFIKIIFFINIISLIIFSLTYFQYFLSGGSLRGFFGVQKYIFTFYRQTTIDTTKLLGNYLSLILFNRWRFWSTGYPFIKYESWSILWPIIFVFGIYSLIKLIKQIPTDSTDLNIIVKLLFSFLISYNLFLFIIPIFPRYLLLLFVPLNILISIFIINQINQFKQ